MVHFTKTQFVFSLCFLFLGCAHKLSSNSDQTSTAVGSSKGTEIEKVVSLANDFKALLTEEQKKTLQLGWSKK